MGGGHGLALDSDGLPHHPPPVPLLDWVSLPFSALGRHRLLS
jgi:hypothetical protein